FRPDHLRGSSIAIPAIAAVRAALLKRSSGGWPRDRRRGVGGRGSGARSERRLVGGSWRALRRRLISTRSLPGPVGAREPMPGGCAEGREHLTQRSKDFRGRRGGLIHELLPGAEEFF